MKETERTKDIARANVEQASEMYLNSPLFRAIITAIPWVGGSFDALLAGEGAKIQYERIKKHIDYLHERLEKLEVGNELEPNGALWDLLVRTFDGVARERSDEKRKRFASIIVKQVEENGDIGEAIDAADLLRDLNDIHIEVLKATHNAPTCKRLFAGDQVVTLHGPEKADLSGDNPLPLDKTLPRYDIAMLRIACAQLVAKGLMQDHGVGKLSTPAMFFFILTDAGKWFVDWILEENELEEKL